jgi:two-component system, sensor histidine kinase
MRQKTKATSGGRKTQRPKATKAPARNVQAAARALSSSDLQKQLKVRTRERDEALAQQAATSRILRVISAKPTDIQWVFETVVEYAVKLCKADRAILFRFDGEFLRIGASYNAGPDIQSFVQSNPIALARHAISGRAGLERRTVQVVDVQADPEFDYAVRDVDLIRTVLAVPMLKGDVLVGVITIYRLEIKPFTDAQIALVETFASQAVIAIENTRLFDELRQKRHQLEIANTHKSRFLATASHDLRQPLHALNLFVAQLRSAPDPVEQNRVIGHIETATRAMNELFEALMDISKLDAGVLAPNLVEFPIERIFRRLQTTFAEAAREKGLRLNVVSSKEWVRSDFILLERILLNLVSNAVRYTARGGVLVGCRSRGPVLRIEIWDTGPGIPVDQQSNVFAEFYRLAESAADRGAGLGLGLSIVDRLCRMLGHDVELISRLGEGSRFVVSVSRVGARPDALSSAPTPSVIADHVLGKLIVVIDDDTLVREGMRGILQSWGCRVVTAASDAEALSELSQDGSRPDVIISDYRLGDGKTGIEVIDWLRRELGDNVPAFLVSGDTLPDRLREATASGHLLLHKPVLPMTLRTALNRLLKRRPVSGRKTHHANLGSDVV